MFDPGKITTLGNRSDLFLLNAQAEVIDRGDYLRIETPDNHGYFWGNFLFFPRPPQADDFAWWQDCFRHEFRRQPSVRHMTFGWDSQEQGATDAFVANGFQLESTSVLTLEGEPRRPERMHSQLSVRPLQSDADWEAMIENQIACRLDGFKRETYEPFKRRQAAAYRRLAESGAGSWYGGFWEGKLVADCGLFFFKDLGRFQAVGTHPSQRRKGICAALIYQVCLEAVARRPDAILVMAAAAGEPAERIYRCVGFTPSERQFGLCRWPREEWLS